MDFSLIVIVAFCALVACLIGLMWWFARTPACPLCGSLMQERQLDARGFERYYCARCEQWMYVEKSEKSE